MTQTKADWKSQLEALYKMNCGYIVLEDFIEELLTQKDAEKATWLRSEIEKLESEEIKSDPQTVVVNAHIATWEQGYNHAKEESITRYKEELLELDGKEV